MNGMLTATQIEELIGGVPEPVYSELKAKLEKQGPLTKNWCQCEPECEFRCYPENGACSCGIFKHHVHGVCGGLLQIG